MAQKRTKSSRRRPAKKTPVIDLEANEVADDETTESASQTASGETATDSAETATEDAAAGATGAGADDTASSDGDSTATEASAAATETASSARDGDEADDSRQAAPPPPASAGGSGAGRMVMTLLIALIAGGAGGWLAVQYGMPRQDTADVAALQDRIATLESASAKETNELSKLNDRLAAIKMPDIDALQAKIDKMATANQSATAAGDAATRQVGDLQAQLTAVSDTVNQLGSDVASLHAALEKAASEGGGAATAASEAAIGNLKARIDTLAGSLSEIRASQDNIQSQALADLTRKLTDLEAKVDETAEAAKTQASSASAEQTALGSAFAALRAKAESGAPFATELADLKKVHASSKAYPALEPFAADGIPGDKTLAAELATIDLEPQTAGTASSTDQTAPAGSDNASSGGTAGNANDSPTSAAVDSVADTAGQVAGTVWSGFKDSFFKVVKVRDKARADWTEALNRARNELAAGKLGTAIGTLAGVDHPTPQPVAAWLERAYAVQAARLALTELSDEVIVKLTGTNG